MKFKRSAVFVLDIIRYLYGYNIKLVNLRKIFYPQTGQTIAYLRKVFGNCIHIVIVDFKSFNYSKLALYIWVEYTYLSYTYSHNYLNFQVFLCTQA